MPTPYNPHNQTELPKEHYMGLFHDADPTEIAARTGAEYDPETKRFNVSMLGEKLSVTWPDYPEATWKGYENILCIRYLLEGKRAPAYSDFITYREMPWGEVYDVNFQGRCVKRLARTFGASPDGFRRAAEALGAQSLQSSGIGYQICFMPGLFLRFFLWEGDDEFPASAQILFSDNFPAVFSAEDRVVLCETVIGRMKKLQ